MQTLEYGCRGRTEIALRASRFKKFEKILVSELGVLWLFCWVWIVVDSCSF